MSWRCSLCRLLGVIPESKSVLQASNTGTPVILDDRSLAGNAYRDAVARFMGEQIEYRFASEGDRFDGQAWLWPPVAAGRMNHWAEDWVRKSVGIFSFFRSSPPQRSADQAKERLQVLLALERSSSNAPSFPAAASGRHPESDREIHPDRQRQGVDRGGARSRCLDARYQYRASGGDGGQASEGAGETAFGRSRRGNLIGGFRKRAIKDARSSPSGVDALLRILHGDRDKRFCSVLTIWLRDLFDDGPCRPGEKRLRSYIGALFNT